MTTDKILQKFLLSTVSYLISNVLIRYHCMLHRACLCKPITYWSIQYWVALREQKQIPIALVRHFRWGKRALKGIFCCFFRGQIFFPFMKTIQFNTDNTILFLGLLLCRINHNTAIPLTVGNFLVIIVRAVVVLSASLLVKVYALLLKKFTLFSGKKWSLLSGLIYPAAQMWSNYLGKCLPKDISW